MIEYINQISELIINVVVIIGITFLLYFYIKLKYIDSEIEKLHRDFEIKRQAQRGQGRGWTIQLVTNKIDKLKQDRDELLAPLKRERQIIISEIPFIK